MFKSVMTPSAMVCPCATCAVIANAGATGNCVRQTRNCGYFFWRSRNQTLLHGATGYTFASGIPLTCQFVAV